MFGFRKKPTLPGFRKDGTGKTVFDLTDEEQAAIKYYTEPYKNNRYAPDLAVY